MLQDDKIYEQQNQIMPLLNKNLKILSTHFEGYSTRDSRRRKYPIDEALMSTVHLQIHQREDMVLS